MGVICGMFRDGIKSRWWYSVARFFRKAIIKLFKFNKKLFLFCKNKEHTVYYGNPFTRINSCWCTFMQTMDLLKLQYCPYGLNRFRSKNHFVRVRKRSSFVLRCLFCCHKYGWRCSTSLSKIAFFFLTTGTAGNCPEVCLQISTVSIHACWLGHPLASSSIIHAIPPY